MSKIKIKKLVEMEQRIKQMRVSLKTEEEKVAKEIGYKILKILKSNNYNPESLRNIDCAFFKNIILSVLSGERSSKNENRKVAENTDSDPQN